MTTQALVTVESLKQELFKDQFKQLTQYMKDEQSAIKFLGSVAYCFQSVPALANCEKTSIASAFMKIAELNLFPSTVSGEAYVLPYKGKAQFQLGYKGIVTLLYRAGVTSIYTDIVKKNDKIKVLGGTDAGIYHEYALGDRGEAIGAYAVANINGDKIWKYMSKDEILEFKKFSQSAGSDYSPWNQKNDPELNMWKKTVIKQVAKTLPQNENLAKAISDDNEE